MGRRPPDRRYAEPGTGRGAHRLAALFGIDPGNVHIRSLFLGGGFGSKGTPWAPQVLGVMAARLVGRPVKLVTRRDQMYGPVGHRAPTRQSLALGAGADGGLTAIGHHTLTASSTFDDFSSRAPGRPGFVCHAGAVHGL